MTSEAPDRCWGSRTNVKNILMSNKVNVCRGHQDTMQVVLCTLPPNEHYLQHYSDNEVDFAK